MPVKENKFKLTTVLIITIVVVGASLWFFSPHAQHARGHLSQEEAKVHVDKLMGLMQTFNPDAINQLVLLNRREDVVPILEKYARGGFQPARIALARLRVKNYYKTIFDECIAKFSLPKDYEGNEAKESALQTLGYIGGNEAIRTVAQFLFDDTSGFNSGDQISVPIRTIAATTLAQVVPNPPTPPGHIIFEDEDIKKWREWWLKNKSKYEKN